MKKILLLTLFNILFSCNQDLEILPSKTNSECAKQLTCFGSDSDLNYSFPSANNEIAAIPSLDKEYNRYSGQKISNPINIKILEETQSLNLKNNSKTKIYNVRIQKTNYFGKIAYKDFKIEPTQELCIGCDKYFDIDFPSIKESINGSNFNTYYQYIYPFEGNVKKILNCTYKIYDSKVISEY